MFFTYYIASLCCVETMFDYLYSLTFADVQVWKCMYASIKLYTYLSHATWELDQIIRDFDWSGLDMAYVSELMSERTSGQWLRYTN